MRSWLKNRKRDSEEELKPLELVLVDDPVDG